MLTRVIAGLVFAVSLAGVLAVSDPIGAADDAAKAKKAAKKQKAPPPDTKAMFKKLDTNGDGKLDLEEFKKLPTVMTIPKGGKKAKETGPKDLATVFKSLDSEGKGMLSEEDFAGVIAAVAPPRK